jgi:CRISPR-associated protein (TIGR03984 family)
MAWARTIQPYADLADPVSTDGVAENLSGWLTQQAAAYGLTHLLAHADDGVIWGRFDPSGLVTSSDAARAAGAEECSPPLREVTLQTARAFSPAAELLLWRDGAAWLARVIRPAGPGETPDLREAFDEEHLLWGTTIRPLIHGFVLAEHGRQGLRHAPPIDLPERPYSLAELPLRLRLRHYVGEDELGMARVAVSRLVSLFSPEAI